MSRPIFAADRTFYRIKEAAILADLASTGPILIEVVCCHWFIKVRGCVYTGGGRHWRDRQCSWDEVQSEEENPLTWLVEKIVDDLKTAVAAAAKPALTAKG